MSYDGKVISSQNDFKRNEIATKKLKDKNAQLSWDMPKKHTEVEFKQQPIMQEADLTALLKAMDWAY